LQNKNKKFFNDKGYIILENQISQEICNAIIKKAKLLKDKGVIWESLWAALTFGVIRANGL